VFLKRIFIKDFRALKDVELVFNENFKPTVYPIGSLNGGGKSSLLQLIFSLLKFSFSNENKDFLSNILSYYLGKNGEFPVAEMDIITSGEVQKISFLTVSGDFNGINLAVLSEVSNLAAQYEKETKLNAIYAKIANIAENPSEFDKISSSRQRVLRDYLLSYSKTSGNKGLIEESRSLNGIVSSNSSIEIEDLFRMVHHHHTDIYIVSDRTRLDLISAKKDLKLTKDSLDKEGCKYICHIGDDTVLLCKSTLDLESLSKISSKVYLATPASQVLLFLPKEVRENAFRTYGGSYYQKFGEILRKTGVFTYGIESSNIIADAFKSARDKDFRSALESDQYGENLSKLKRDLNSFLNDKDITIDPDFSRVVFKLRSNGQELLPEDLSHGELRKLSIFIWLTLMNPGNSIVLMDEVEIGMHPDWQFSIVGELQEWSKDSQFILATHSYELCQAVTPAHVNELRPSLIKKGS